MNGAVKLLAWLLALALVALPVLGVLQGWFAVDRWPVTRLSVSAQFDHVSSEQISAAAQPFLGKGFFATRLGPMRDAIARLPWVERVEARKRWPDTIELVIHEQQPYARWSGDRLVNRNGKLFAAGDAVGLESLPRLSGPDDRIDDILRFYAQYQPEFAAAGMVIQAVHVSPRDGWRIGLAAGTTIDVGREQRIARLQRFLDVWPRLSGSHAQPPQHVDLRYANGFAVAWPAEVALPAGGVSAAKPVAAESARLPMLADVRIPFSLTRFPSP